ncbi:MaoC/PaaZ C-terminal domain-containing protein [Flindersiella endophytica]
MRVVLEEPPNSLALLAKAAVSRGHCGGQLPDTELALPEQAIDRAQLAEYARVCGYPIGDELPACYPHVLAFPLGLQLMTSEDFPFAAKGLVHVGNSLTVQRPLLAGERLTVSVRLDALRPHRRGTQFDVLAEVASGGETVWSERSTYLRRERRPADPQASPKQDSEPAPLPLSARWRVPGDLGRSYAHVSGDYNPIHLHPLSARLFGYRRPIAHGMWTKARCLAAFQGRLPDAYTAEVSFAAPILLPSTVSFGASRSAQDWDFEVRTRSDRVALRGTVRAA